MDIIWNAETVRKLATSICNTEGISIVESKEPGLVPNAQPLKKNIVLGPFNILHSKEYMWHMFHEIGHLLPENLWHYRAFLEIIKEVENDTMHPAAKGVANILMDHLADKSRLGTYPGRDRALSEGLYEYAVKEDVIKRWETKSPLLSALFAVDFDLRSAWQLAVPYAVPQTVEHLYEAIIDMDYEDRMFRMSTPKDLIQLTKDIITVATDADKEDQKKQQQQQQQNNNGQQTTQSSNPLGDAGKVGKELSKMKTGPGQMPDVEEPSFDTSQGSGYVPKRNIRDTVTKGMSPVGYWRTAIEDALKGLNLSKKMRKYLLALKQRAWNGGLTHGRLHQKNLHRVVHGGDRPRVFKKREQPRLNQSSSIMVLQDCSGSMSNDRRVIASACSISVVEICQDLRVPVESRGFTDHRGGYIEDILFTKFSETFVSRDHLLDRFSADIDMDINADAESIVRAHERIYIRPEANKLLVVLSDGQPTGGTSIGNNQTYLKEVCDNIERNSNVKLFGIGIATESVKHFYRNWATVKEPSELEGVLIKLLKGHVVI